MRAAEQVPLLLQMKEDKVALVKAVASGDTDLGKSLNALLVDTDQFQSIMSFCICVLPCRLEISSISWTIQPRQISLPQSSSYRYTQGKAIDNCSETSTIKTTGEQRPLVWRWKKQGRANHRKIGCSI